MKLAGNVLAFVTLCALEAAPIRADVIQLKDGRSFTGRIYRDGDHMVIKTDDGLSITAQPQEVVRVTLTSTITPEQAAESDWTRIAAQIKKADNLADVIALHEKFLAKWANTSLAATVQTSLDEYKKLQQQDAVRFRGQWMPRAQAEVILRLGEDNARPALLAYKAGRIKDALDAAQAALKLDAENPTALVVAGLAAYRNNDLGLARQYFSKLSESDPANLLALNNAAVVCFLQKHEAEGLLYYTKALAVMPDHRLLLDNILEAINSYTGDKDGQPFKNLIRQFDQAETNMEASLAKKDLYRFGSTWVTRDQLDRLTAQRKQIQDAMNTLDSRYRAAVDAAARTEQDIRLANSDFDSMAANVSYLSMLILGGQQRGDDVSLMISQRDAEMAELNQIQSQRLALNDQYAKLTASFKLFKADAELLKTQMAGIQTAQYTGIQRMFEPGDVENPPPPAPANLPPKPVASPAAPAAPTTKAFPAMQTTADNE